MLLVFGQTFPEIVQRPVAKAGPARDHNPGCRLRLVRLRPETAPIELRGLSLRGDIAGMQSVKTALAMGEATTNVAINAAKALSDLLIEMKAKVVQANQAGLDTDSKDALFNEQKTPTSALLKQTHHHASSFPKNPHQSAQ